MGIHIDDLSNRDHSLRSNWWNWRATVEIIRSFNLFDDARLNDLSDGIGEFSPDETRTLIEYLDLYVTSQLALGARVLLDGTITEEPDDGTFYRSSSEQHLNYSADREWLTQFVAFCKKCEGIYIC